jgi:hypothetical protein
MKLFGIDTDKEYTEEELDSIRARWDKIFSRTITATIIICAGATAIAYLLKHI